MAPMTNEWVAIHARVTPYPVSPARFASVPPDPDRPGET